MGEGCEERHRQECLCYFLAAPLVEDGGEFFSERGEVVVGEV